MYPDCRRCAVEVGEASLCGAGGISMTCNYGVTRLLAPDLPSPDSEDSADEGSKIRK